MSLDWLYLEPVRHRGADVLTDLPTTNGGEDYEAPLAGWDPWLDPRPESASIRRRQAMTTEVAGDWAW